MARDFAVDQTARDMINQLKDRVEALERHVAGLGGSQPAPQFESAFDQFRSDEFADIRDIARGGNLIEAIRQYRMRTGVGLAEAKAAVERL